MKYNIKIIFFFLFCAAQYVNGQTIAFPEAEGGGRFATGGRGGKVFIVTNLNNDGKGSLRWALKQDTARIIVFAVSGYIDLEKPLEIKKGNVTIAGQTAPGDGICLRNYGLRIDADNVILRYIRVRPGDKIAGEHDALTVRNSENVMIDHCSFSWGNDETATAYGNKNFTMQWCMITESLNKSHHSKGEHGYGGIWGGHNASFLYNVLAHHKSRNPRLQGNRLPSDDELVEIRNNVIYNWGIKCIYAGEGGKYDIIGNYFKPGAATRKAQRKTFLEVWTPESRFYVNNNYFYGEEEITANNSLGVITNKEMDNNLLGGVFMKKPFFPESKVNDNPQQLLTNVLQNAGASYKRDAIDTRIANEILQNTVSASGTYGEMMGLIDSQEAVGGYPELKSSLPLQDSDGDGMPDEWEIKNGLDPNRDDSALYTLHKSYTNIEIYINSL